MSRTLLLLPLLLCSLFAGTAQARDSYRIAWTIYAGSMPLAYAQETGILQKWGERYGFDLEAVQMNDYIEAITQFSLGQFDGVISMSLDALTIPAAAGVDTTVILPLSASHGSDGLIVRKHIQTLADLRGKSVNLVELSGSHYLLTRALQSVGLRERDITVVNTSDADIASTFESPSVEAVATWKPQLTGMLDQYPDTHVLFDSSAIPGELLDVLVARTDVLTDNPALGQAIAGAWYEAAAALAEDHPQHEDFMRFSASVLNTDTAGVASQFSTIDFFDAAQARTLIHNDDFAGTQRYVTHFAFDHGLLGDNAPNADFIGIQTGDGRVLGNPDNVKLRFVSTWLEAQP